MVKSPVATRKSAAGLRLRFIGEGRMTRAIYEPTPDEKSSGKLVAQVRDGLLTPQEAEDRLRSLRSGAPRPDRSAKRAQVPR